jgi:dTDP-glucose 4,6-dehydratase/UDP-glucose 4-epimerase
MTQRILVTGGLGFLGASLSRALARAGHSVRILDDASRGRVDDETKAFGIELVHGDVRDAAAVDQAVQGVDAIFHLAFVNGTRHFYERPTLVLDVGVRGMINVIDAALARNVRTLVLASSSEVYQTPPYIPTDERVPLSIPDPFNPRYSYAAGKLISEILAINYGRSHFERLLIFRPHNVYGPRMGWEHVIPEMVVRMAQSVQATAPGKAIDFPIQGDGRETRAFIYVDDFTRGLMTVFDRGEHMNIYNIGTMEEVAIADVAHKIAARFNVTLNLLASPAAAGGTPRRCPDIAKLRALGFEPSLSLDEGLGPTTDWYRSHLNEKR